MTEDVHRSPLADWHEAHDAEVLIEDGWPWYMHEGSRSAGGVRGDPHGRRDLGPVLHEQVRGDRSRRRPADPAPVHELPGRRARRRRPLRRVRQRRRPDDRRRASVQVRRPALLGDDQHGRHRGLVPRDGRRPGRHDHAPHRGPRDDLGPGSEGAGDSSSPSWTATSTTSDTSGSGPSPCRWRACPPTSFGPGSAARRATRS